MTRLSKILEDFADGQDVLVKLNNGNEFLLFDFEMVDESIYGCDDLVLATIRNVVKSQFRYRNGTKIELSIQDIVVLEDPITGVLYYSV